MADVAKAADGSWTYECPGVDGDPCGPFTSAGWPTKAVAEARGEHHAAEHADGTLMPSLDDFRTEHGLVPHADGTRAIHAGGAS